MFGLGTQELLILLVILAPIGIAIALVRRSKGSPSLAPLRETRPPTKALWVWSIVIVLLSALGIAFTLYEVVSAGSTIAIVELVRFAIWGAIFGWLARQSAERQNFTRRRFWMTAGVFGGVLVVVPMWHHGREWKSAARRVGGLLFFTLAVLQTIRGIGR